MAEPLKNAGEQRGYASERLQQGLELLVQAEL